jgi:tetratricopeptide (TPR) repeat protein
MNAHLAKPVHLVLLAVFGALTAVAWWGAFDTLSADYIDQALVAAGVIYATARGINALVSVLQGTELDVVMLTFSIGELLDPVNDLIERFSDIMLIALGSLAMQKILLGMVSHRIFNWLLTGLALATGAALLAKSRKLYPLLLRSFAVMVFLRFSLGLVVLTNNWVDIYFLSAEDMRRHAAMENFEGELRQLSAVSGMNRPPDDVVQAAAARVESLEKTRASELNELAGRNSERLQALNHLDRLRDASDWWQKWNPLIQDSPEVAAVKQEIGSLEDEIASLEMSLASIDEALARQKADLACMHKREAGETCSFMEHVVARLSPAELEFRINSLQDRVSEFAENAIALLMSALLKSIFIPLAFFYLLIRIVGASWTRIR